MVFLAWDFLNTHEIMRNDLIVPVHLKPERDHHGWVTPRRTGEGFEIGGSPAKETRSADRSD